jgi:CBS domain-containing protein
VLVSEVMSGDVEFLPSAATVQDAAELMGEIDVGALPIGVAERLDGIVTDRDILYRVVARGLDPSTTAIRDIISRPVITCSETDTVQTAMDLMAANHIRRLPVRSTAGSITGWVTLTDLSRYLLVNDAALQSALMALSEPG